MPYFILPKPYTPWKDLIGVDIKKKIGGVGVTLVLKWRNVVISTQMNQIKLIQLILSLQSSFARAATLDRQTPTYRL